MDQKDFDTKDLIYIGFAGATLFIIIVYFYQALVMTG